MVVVLQYNEFKDTLFLRSYPFDIQIIPFSLRYEHAMLEDKDEYIDLLLLVRCYSSLLYSCHDSLRTPKVDNGNDISATCIG